MQRSSQTSERRSSRSEVLLNVGTAAARAAKAGVAVAGIATLTSVFYVAVLIHAWEDWLHVRHARRNRESWQD